jgi:transposase
MTDPINGSVCPSTLGEHDFVYEPGDWSVGVPGAYVCRCCGHVDDRDREPPSESDEDLLSP